jgi:hypothetical protein
MFTAARENHLRRFASACTSFAAEIVSFIQIKHLPKMGASVSRMHRLADYLTSYCCSSIQYLAVPEDGNEQLDTSVDSMNKGMETAGVQTQAIWTRDTPSQWGGNPPPVLIRRLGHQQLARDSQNEFWPPPADRHSRSLTQSALNSETNLHPRVNCVDAMETEGKFLKVRMSDPERSCHS